MESTLRAIINEASKTNPEYGEYKSHGTDPFSQGTNVLATTGYTLGVPGELITDFPKGAVDNETIADRLIVKRQPNKGE